MGLVLRCLYLLLRSFFAKPTPASQPGKPALRCAIGSDLVSMALVAVLAVCGTLMRLHGSYVLAAYGPLYAAGAPWPLPFLPQLSDLYTLTRYSTILFGLALLACSLRLVLYYSVLSPKLFMIRHTIARASVRLAPTLLLLTVALIGFAIGGNTLFQSASAQWASISTSLSTTVYLMRRPMAMDLHAMEQADFSKREPAETADSSVVAPLFLWVPDRTCQLHPDRT